MRWFGWIPAGVLLLAGSQAHASDVARDGATDERSDTETCAGRFSVFRPKPSRCLEDIETDRPHKTDTPKVVEPGHAQIEMGVIEYEIAKLGASRDADSLVLMNDIYKLGVWSGVDVEALHALGSYGVRDKRVRLDSQIMIRSKIGVLGGGPSAFALTLVPAVVVPLAKDGAAEAGGSAFIGGELPGHVDVEVNVGAVTHTDLDTTRRHVVAIVTGALTRRLAGPISGFVEWYNDAPSSDVGKWNASADSGLLVLVHRDVQLDAGAYVGLWGAVPAITPFFGLSARL